MALVARLQEEYIIYGIWGIVRRIINKCLDCQRNKPLRHKLYRKLQLVKILSKSWEVVLWDFIVKLLKSKDLVTGQEYDSILVIVEKATKWGYFILYMEEMSVEDLLEVYIKEVFARHGAPMKIILDWDLRF